MSQFSYFCDSTDYWIPVLLYSFTVDISFICSIQANHRPLLNLQKNSEMHRIKSLAKQSPHPSTMPSVITHGLRNWGLVQGYIRPTCAFLVASFCLWVNLCTPSFYVLLSTMSTVQGTVVSKEEPMVLWGMVPSGQVADKHFCCMLHYFADVSFIHVVLNVLNSLHLHRLSVQMLHQVKRLLCHRAAVCGQQQEHLQSSSDLHSSVNRHVSLFTVQYTGIISVLWAKVSAGDGSPIHCSNRCAIFHILCSCWYVHRLCCLWTSPTVHEIASSVTVLVNVSLV